MSLHGWGRRWYYDVQICNRLRSVNPWERVEIWGLWLELEGELGGVTSITYHNMRGRRFGSGCETKLAALLGSYELGMRHRETRLLYAYSDSRNVAGMCGVWVEYSPCIRLTRRTLRRHA